MSKHRIEKSLFENRADFGLFLVEVPSGKIIRANSKIAEILEIPRDSLVGGSMHNLDYLVHEDDIQLVMGTGDLMFPTAEFRIIPKSGQIKWVYQTSQEWSFEDSKVMCIWLYDITEKKLKERELREKLNSLEHILDKVNEIVAIVSKDLEIKYLNSSFDLLDEKSDKFVGRSILEPGMMPEIFRSNLLLEKVHEVLEKNAPIVEKITIESNLGKNLTFQVRLLPFQSLLDAKICDILVFAQEITVQTELMNQTFQITKHMNLELLARTSAHNLANNLGAALGNISLAKLTTEEHSESFEHIENSEKVLMKMSGLIDEFRNFTRQKTELETIVNFEEILNVVINSFRNITKHTIEYNPLEKMPKFPIDEQAAFQVLSNIILNGLESMENHKILKVSASIQDAAELDLPLAEGRYICIAVEDQGPGIPREIQSKLFEPYFTTKIKGEGLGLFFTHQIMQDLGGSITFSSQIGQGTTFHLYFPIQQPDMLSSKNIDEISQERPVKGGLVLVVNNEHELRNLLGKMLATLGFSPIYANDTHEAFEIIKKAKEKDKSIICVISGTSIEWESGKHEDIPRIFMAEETEEIESGNDPQHEFTAALQQPVTLLKLKKLMESLTEILSEP